MRILVALTVLQIAAIVFLATRIMGPGQGEPDRTADACPEPTAISSKTGNPSPTSTEVRPLADERLLRRIVREELAAQLTLLAQPDPQPAEQPDPAVQAELQLQRELVEQEIEHYISVGRISDVEMQTLQADIGRLDAEGQREMLSRLVRAINAGEIEGRL